MKVNPLSPEIPVDEKVKQQMESNLKAMEQNILRSLLIPERKFINLIEPTKKERKGEKRREKE